MTSRRWGATFGALTKAVVFSFSLIVTAWAQDGDIIAKARQRQDDPIIKTTLDQAVGTRSTQAERENATRELEGLVKRYDAEHHAIANEDLAKDAARIKRNPLYSDPAEKKSANWFSNSMEKLGSLLRRLTTPKIKTPDMNVPAWNASWLGATLMVLAWTLLGGIVLLFVYWMVKHFRWKATLKRRAKAVLDEDEPERTLDEWLALADEHEREGRYREAVRCLYLACLLKFDEAGVARFDRGQTNWEHLYRIEGSLKLPYGLDFREPTRMFDRIWYGHIVRGAADVTMFRDIYLDIKSALSVARAA
jgi:hypothetical protein